jgi:Salt stress response/antifungal
MQKITHCLFALFLANLCLHPASAYEIYKVCNMTKNYTDYSAYGFNLRNLFSSLSAQAAAKQGFCKGTIGTAPDQISGLVLCRGDVDSSTCGDCLSQSFKCVTKLCQYSKEVTIFDDFCLIHYSDRQFLNTTENIDSFMTYKYNPQNMTNNRFIGWDRSNSTIRNYFHTVMNSLLKNVAHQAAFKSRNRFGTAMINISESLPVIYGLSQCTPDFSNYTCRACLQDLIDQMLKYFDGWQSGQIFGIRCTLRYDTSIFFLGDPDVQISSISGTVTRTHQASGNQPSSTSTGEYYPTPDMAFDKKKKLTWSNLSLKLL